MIWREFLSRVEQNSHNIAIEADGVSLTYSELSTVCQSLASGLPVPENGKINRVLIKQQHQLSYLLHILSCWCAGLVPVLLRSGITSADEKFIRAQLQPVEIRYDEVDLNEVRPDEFHRPSNGMLQARQEALVMGTSGTTGIPKLVALPAESVSLNANVIAAELELVTGDRVAVCTPLSYMYGLMGGSIATLWAGATLQLFDPKQPLAQFQSEIRNRGTNIVQGPPSLLRLFMAYWNGKPFPGVRLVTTGGEQLVSSLMDGLEAAFPNARKQLIFGMTEAGPRISHVSFGKGGGQDGCIGIPFGHIDWRLVPQGIDKSDSGVGRLSIKGPSVFLGYIGDKGTYQGLDEDGYFLSPDILKLRSDGNLSFVGRFDRLFKSGGKLVSPDFVEQTLSNFPGISEVACRPDPHRILGLVPVAEVYLEAEENFNKQAFGEFAKLNLEPHCVPRAISFHTASSDAMIGGDLELFESGKRKRIDKNTG